MAESKDLDKPVWVTVERCAELLNKDESEIVCMAEAGQIIFCVPYEAPASAFKNEFSKAPPLYWNLDRQQVMKLVKLGHLHIAPPGIFSGIRNNEGLHVKQIYQEEDNEMDGSPVYEPGYWVPQNELLVTLESVRVATQQFGLCLLNSVGNKSAVKKSAQNNTGGRPLAVHTILIKYFLSQYPSGTWKKSSPNFFSWLLSKKGRSEYTLDGCVYDIEIAESGDEGLEFSLDGDTSKTVTLETIQSQFTAVKKIFYEYTNK